MLKLRILTALILIPLTIAIIFYLPERSFFLLTNFILLGAAWEWSHLMEINDKSWRILYLVFIQIMMIIACFIPTEIILYSGFIWWLIAAVLIILYPRLSSGWGGGNFWRGLMGVLVLVPCWRAINFIHMQPDGPYALLFLFVLIWGADSAAYFAGRKWGKHKLAPLVSPGKSMEGLFGAIICTIIIALAAQWICQTPKQTWGWGLLLGIFTVLFSVEGDLFESMIKRKANLKDSGQLLPGHGGLLDRIDSLTSAAPIFAFGAMVMGKVLSVQ